MFARKSSFCIAGIFKENQQKGAPIRVTKIPKKYTCEFFQFLKMFFMNFIFHNMYNNCFAIQNTKNVYEIEFKLCFDSKLFRWILGFQN